MALPPAASPNRGNKVESARKSREVPPSGSPSETPAYTRLSAAPVSGSGKKTPGRAVDLAKSSELYPRAPPSAARCPQEKARNSSKVSSPGNRCKTRAPAMSS